MSYLLTHLRSGYAVDQAILAEEDRVVVLRFGHDWDATCMQVCGSGGGAGARGARRALSDAPPTRSLPPPPPLFHSPPHL
jgi:hypothetical protein